MLPKSFAPPPFVAWLIECEREHAIYQLVPHAVFRNVLIQCLWQWAALFFVLQVALHYDRVSPFVAWPLWVAALPAFVSLGMLFNVQILRLLNLQPTSKIGTLLNLSPPDSIDKYKSWLPKMKDTRRPRWRPFMITWYSLVYFLRRRFDDNAVKLESLRRRKEDSWLHAFSAFAAATTFLSERPRHLAIPTLQAKFILNYFSPLGFGFALCLVTFVAYPVLSHLAPSAGALPHAEAALPRFPFMICIFVWFCQGALYLLLDLRHDFTAIFHNYFDTRIFPKSMTRFADEQMAIVPDLVGAMDRWVPWAIGIVMFGLAELYASFMHSLA